MRGGGLGGPLLCIGDLLHDVGEEDTTTTTANDLITPVEATDLTNHQIHPSHLTNLYQESYKCLNDALDGTSHSWTAHTLEDHYIYRPDVVIGSLSRSQRLCLALETANKLIQSSNSHVIEISSKIRDLVTITNKGKLVIKEAESIHTSMQ